MTRPESTRRAQLERARRRRKGGAVTALAIAVVVLAAIGIGAWRINSGAKSNSQSAVSNPARSTTSLDAIGASLAKVVGKKPPRALSHDDPLRLWVGGDSLAGELGPTLGTELAPTGIVQTTVDFRVGSGLHDNSLRNWPERAPSQMASYTPDVAIFVIGANDASIVGSDTNAWAPGYRAKVSEMMDLLGGADHHRTVYWVGPPTMGSPSLDRGAKALGALMADEAHHHPHVVYVDAYSMFSGPDGGYSSHLNLPAALGGPDTLVRISDGVHFTNAGASYIAYNVAKLLDEQWQITKQSGGKAITVTVETGGGSVPGYRPPYRPRYYPTSAPPVTTAPPTSAPTGSSVPPSSVGTGSSTPSSAPRTTVSTPKTTAPHNTTSGGAPPST